MNQNQNQPAAPYVNKWLITVSIMLPTVMEIIDTSVANVALTNIQGSLSAGVDEVTWVLTSYLVSNAIILPVTGWLSNFFGRKLFLMACIVIFTVTSFLCGSAPNLESLVFFRVLQGLGGGALQPLSQAILLESFPQKEHGMAMAVFGVGVMLGPILGPVLGGWITDTMSWRWIFYINIPIGIIAAILVFFFVHDPHYIKRGAGKIDYIGLGLLAVGLGSLQIVLDKGEREGWFESDFIIILSVISFICLTLFIIVELFSKNPVVDLRVFKAGSFTAGNIIIFTGFLTFFSSIVLLPLYLQTLMGYTATLAGIVLSPGGIVTLFCMPAVGILISKFNPRYILAFGLVVNAYSLYLMSVFNLDSSFEVVIMPRLIQGVGIACFFVPLTTLTLTEISKEKMGNATGIYNLLRNLGGSFGVAYVTTMLTRRYAFHKNHLSESINYFDPDAEIYFRKFQEFLSNHGYDPFNSKIGSLKIMDALVSKHSMMIAFNDVFFLIAALTAAIIPLVYFFRKKHH